MGVIPLLLGITLSSSGVHVDQRGNLLRFELPAIASPIADLPVCQQPVRKVCVVLGDSDGDRNVDSWLAYDANGRLKYEVFVDDHAVIAHYDTHRASSICLKRLTRDRNGDGQADVLAVYENCQLQRRIRDDDFDGRDDRWEYFTESKDSEPCRQRIEIDRNFNTRIDFVETYYQCAQGLRQWDRNENGRFEATHSIKVGDRWISRIGFDAMAKADYHFGRGEYRQAEEWYVRAIAEFRDEWGADSPTINKYVATCLIGRGLSYAEQNTVNGQRWSLYHSKAREFISQATDLSDDPGIVKEAKRALKRLQQRTAAN